MRLRVASARLDQAVDRAAGDQGRRFVLELEAEPGEVPAEVRLKRLLKIAMRSFGLRCTAVHEGGGADEGDAGQQEQRRAA